MGENMDIKLEQAEYVATKSSGWGNGPGHCEGVAFSDGFKAGYRARDSEVDKLNEMIMDLFSQSCNQFDPKTKKPNYDHMCLSTYEYAQDYLISQGLINEADCSRKWLTRN